MSIPSQCNHCGYSFSAAEKYSGLRVKCPKCKQSITLPTIEMEAADEGPPPMPEVPAKLDKNSPEFKAQVQKIRATALIAAVLFVICMAVGIGSTFLLKFLFS